MRAGWCCTTDGCTSMIEVRVTDMTEIDRGDRAPTPRLSGGALPRFDTQLVPRNSISGRALIAVVAIMTFLASLTTGAVMLVGWCGERMAVRRIARGDHSAHSGAGPRS